MAVTTTKTNKPINPRGNDQSPKGYNRAELYTGKALDFDGVNDVLTASSNLDISNGSDLSYVGYFKTTETTGGYLFENNAFYVAIRRDDFNDGGTRIGKISSFISSSWLDTDLVVNDNHWHQCAMTLSNGTQKIYIDGQEIASATGKSYSTSGQAAPQIGARDTGFYFDGQIANTRVFNVGLTAAQVADLYNNPEKIVPTGVADSALKLWLPMMEGAGTTCYDGSGNGNHGTISGATWTHGVGSPVAQTAVIDWNKYSITDATDYANVSSTTIANEGTIVFKHVPLASITAGYFTFYGAASTGEGRAIRQNGTKYSFVGFGSSPQDFDTSKNVEVGKITNVAYSWNASGDVKVYIDGVKVGDANKTLYPLTSSSFNINRRVDGIQYHNEIMFYAGLYDEVLTESQIQDIQDGTTNPESVSGLVHFWRNSNNWQDEVGSADLTENDNAGKVLFPQTLTSGRDLAGNIFANVRKQGALNLDGNSWAEVHDNASLDVSALTCEGWMYAESITTADNRIVSKWNSSYPERSFQLYGQNATINWMLSDGSAAYSITGGTLTQGQWHHLVGTYDGSTQKIYLDGVQVASTGLSITLKQSSFKVMLGGYTSGLYSLNPIAQPRIYNRALTAAEVLQNYNSGKSIYTNS